MTERKDMRNLEDLLRTIPPEAAGVDPNTVNPWHSAMGKLLWGLGLLTFRLHLWYLPYLLPLLGAGLLYLGARRLRRTNAGFRWTWRLSLGKLVWQGIFLVILATRLGAFLEAGPAFWMVSAVGCGLDFLLLLALRRGIRGAFLDLAGKPPRDWLLPGLAAWLGTLALAVWATLEPVPAGDMAVLWARGMGAAALYGLLLWLLHRQGKALERRGYKIVPTPVRCRDGAVIVLVLLGTVLLTVPAAVWGARTPAPVGTAAGTTDLESVRSHLIDLGMPETLAADLSREDLRLCADAAAVHDSTNHLLNGDPAIPQDLGGGTVDLQSWAVVLPDQSIRFFLTFQWQELPNLSLQEAVSASPDSGKAFTDLTARLTWTEDGTRLAADLPVSLAGGQEAEELTEEQLWWYEEELKRLGRLQYQPYALFSLPRDGEAVRGYLAYSRAAKAEDYSGGSIFGGWYYFHQSAPRYPYQDMEAYLLGRSGQILSFGGSPFPCAGVSYASYVWFTA